MGFSRQEYWSGLPFPLPGDLSYPGPDNGKVILDYMQKSDVPMLKARDVAEGLFISSRAVSGSLRKLVNDGFCEKVGQDPVVYALTDKGRNYKID